MAAHDTQVSHDQIRPEKHPGIEALQNKARFRRALHRHQIGVIDIAVTIFPDIHNPVLRGELCGYANRMIQVCAFFEKFKVQGSKLRARGGMIFS
jgi:hypothetical protein